MSPPTRSPKEPGSIPISLDSSDLESVRIEVEPPPAKKPAPPSPPPRPAKSPRALAITMQQASRPTIPDPPRIEVAPEPAIAAARTIDLRRTLPQGVRDPRLVDAKPSPVIAEAEPPAPPPESEPPAFSDLFKDLGAPSSDLDGAATEVDPTKKTQ
jgi:hypothetical protein